MGALVVSPSTDANRNDPNSNFAKDDEDDMMTRLGSGSADETVQPSIRAHPETHRRANDGAYRAR